MNRGEWQDLFNWAWNDVWSNHLGQPLDVSNIAAYPEQANRLTEALALTAEFYEAARENNGHEDAKHRVFERIMQIAGKVPEPVLPPVGELLPLRVKGRGFVTTAGTPVDYREVGAFTLYDQWFLHGPEAMQFYVDQAREVGATAVRVMLFLGGSAYWQGRKREGLPVVYRQDDDRYRAGLPAFARWLASNGLYLRLCVFGSIDFGGYQIPDRRDHWSGAENAGRRTWARNRLKQIGTLLKDEPNVLWEITNEFNQIGWGSNYADIAQLVRDLKHLGVTSPICGSNENGPNADTPSFVGMPYDYTDSHLNRLRGFGGFEWVKRSSETPVVDSNPGPFLSGEPINFGSAAPGRPEGHDNERSPAVALAYAGTSRMKGYYTNFHCEAALNCERFDTLTRRCADAWKAGLDLIPWDLSKGFRNGHWTESPFVADGTLPTKDTNEETWRGVIRIFGRSDGYWVSVGHRLGFTPTVKSGRTVRQLAGYAHGNYECQVWKEL